jgi:hypothetical protein
MKRFRYPLRPRSRYPPPREGALPPARSFLTPRRSAGSRCGCRGRPPQRVDCGASRDPKQNVSAARLRVGVAPCTLSIWCAMRPSCGLRCPAVPSPVLVAMTRRARSWRVSSLWSVVWLPAAGRDAAAAVATLAVRTRFDGSGSRDHGSHRLTSMGVNPRRTTVTRNFDCSVVKASIRSGTVRLIGGHHGAAVPRHHRFQYICPRYVAADPSVRLAISASVGGLLPFSACGVCAIARQRVKIASPVDPTCPLPVRALRAVSAACPSC